MGFVDVYYRYPGFKDQCIAIFFLLKTDILMILNKAFEKKKKKRIRSI